MMPVLPHGEPFTAVPAKNAPNLSCFPWSVKPRLADHYRILRAMPTHTMQLCIRRTVWRRMVQSEVSETWSVHLPTRNTPKTSAGAACIRAWRRREPKKDQKGDTSITFSLPPYHSVRRCRNRPASSSLTQALARSSIDLHIPALCTTSSSRRATSP